AADPRLSVERCEPDGRHLERRRIAPPRLARRGLSLMEWPDAPGGGACGKVPLVRIAEAASRADCRRFALRFDPLLVRLCAILAPARAAGLGGRRHESQQAAARLL